ncbi:hypothetical protein PAPYR_10655 [Paratrimastix pyriformis]|uniref:Uncharacterized protein n=1 Tax=Paratrimastix pyriformis TaxID=342808 RepID=A0ABQ8U5E1_9EUKA|nr:hypothetical protein PAPYR_10655 [Paratrimastix pyriformis]
MMVGIFAALRTFVLAPWLYLPVQPHIRRLVAKKPRARGENPPGICEARCLSLLQRALRFARRVPLARGMSDNEALSLFCPIFFITCTPGRDAEEMYGVRMVDLESLSSFSLKPSGAVTPSWIVLLRCAVLTPFPPYSASVAGVSSAVLRACCASVHSVLVWTTPPPPRDNPTHLPQAATWRRIESGALSSYLPEGSVVRAEVRGADLCRTRKFAGDKIVVVGVVDRRTGANRSSLFGRPWWAHGIFAFAALAPGFEAGSWVARIGFGLSPFVMQKGWFAFFCFSGHHSGFSADDGLAL